MKPVDVVVKKIEVTDYYSQLDQVKIRIVYNDGKDKVLTDQLTIKEPEKHINDWMTKIRNTIKKDNSEHTLDDDPLAGVVVLRFVQETDVISDKISRFLSMTNERIRSGKLSKMSYFDLEKKVRGNALLLT